MNNLWSQITTPGAFVLVAGPCVIESEQLCLDIAKHLKPICERLGIVYIFKASYDKANRTSAKSYRGCGLAEGMKILARVRRKTRVPVTTDVHEREEIKFDNRVEDVIQIPALLSRQTDLILSAACTRKIVNIKKGQFMAPADIEHAVKKARDVFGAEVMVTERGTTFGYNNLVVDFRSIPIMQSFGVPVLFDATHSVQLPGANGNCSGGQRQFAPTLACAAVAAGANGLFIETHPDPDRALSDGPNMIRLEDMERLLEKCVRIRRAL